MKKYGKIGAPKSAKRKAWMKKIATKFGRKRKRKCSRTRKKRR